MPKVKLKKKQNTKYKGQKLDKVKIRHARKTKNNINTLRGVLAEQKIQNLAKNSTKHAIRSFSSSSDNEESAKQELQQAKKFVHDLKHALTLAKNSEYPLATIPGMVSTITQHMLANILTKVLGEDENALIERLLTLKVGKPKPLIFAREIDATGTKSKNEFKVGVIRDLDGEELLAIFFKGKRFDLTKRKMIREQGAEKICKLTLVIKNSKPELYAELIVPAMPHDKINSALHKIKAEYKKLNGTECSDHQAKELLETKMTGKISEHQQQIKMQQQFHNQPGFTSVIFAGIEHKKVAYNEGGGTIDVPQLIILSPYRHLLITYLDKTWIPEGYSEQSNNYNYDIHNSRMILQIIDVLETMHAAKKEHRDIKTANFLLAYNKDTGEINAELTDFGAMIDFGANDEMSGTPEFCSPRQLQRHFAGKSISKIEQNAMQARSGDDLYRFVNSYGWRIFKQKLHLEGIKERSLIPAPENITIDGSNDIWAFACMYYHMVYNSELRNSPSCERIVENDRLLSAIFLSSNPPTANQLEQIYRQTEHYKNNHSRILRPPSILTSTPTSRWIEFPLASIDQFVGHENKKRQTQDYSKIDKTTAIRGLINLLPKNKDITELVTLLATTKSVKKLIEIADKLQDLINENDKQIDQNVKLTDLRWAQNIGERQLGLNLALMLTYKLIEHYQASKRRTSMLFSCFPSGRTKIALNFKNEIAECETKINELAPIVKESLSSNNFVERYGVRSI